MTGAPPYNAQSPTQQPRFAVYSPPNKSHPFYPNNDQYQQHPPQTPPTFSQHSSLSRSPHYSHASSPMPATLPPLNGSGPPPPHSEHSSQYQQGHPPPGTPQFALPRPFSGPVLSPNGAPLYNHSSPSHAHPPRPGSHSQSPKKEQEQLFSMGADGPGYSGSMMRDPRPSSPKEDVC